MSSAADLEEMSRKSISLMLTNVTPVLRLGEFLLHTDRRKCLELASGAVTKVNRFDTDASDWGLMLRIAPSGGMAPRAKVVFLLLFRRRVSRGD
jgi:hypothetical protein